MAQEINEIEAAKLELHEKDLLELKRVEKQNPNWQPAEGAGIVPEDVWNELPPQEEPQSMVDKVNANLS